MITEEQYQEYKREAAKLDINDIKEIVLKKMWQHKAEDAVCEKYAVSIEVAICFVGRAIDLGIIKADRGFVIPNYGD